MGRHTFATYYILEEKRMSIEALRIMLGHTNIKMTQLYGKLAENRLADEIQECKERELGMIA
jgi:site-specific recombinase XerD